MEKAKIVIVEDERLIALEIEERLKRLGYEVCGKAVSAEDALEVVKQCKPNLILMDIRIEGITDGIETGKLIQEIEKIPVVYLTAHTDAETLNRAKETLPYGYLAKPINEKDLRVTLEMVLHRIKIEQELEKTKEELERSELRNRTLIKTLPDIIFIVNRDGIITDYQSSTEDSLYVGPDIFLNKNYKEILPEYVSDKINRALTGALENNTTELFEYNLPIRHHIRSYEARSVKMNETEAMVIVRDVSDIKKAERELAKKEIQYRLIAENSTDLIYVYSFFPEPHYEYISPSCIQLTGYEPEVGYADPFTYHKFLVDPSGLERFTQFLMDPLQPKTIDEEWKKKDGSHIWVEQSVSRKFDENGNMISFQSTVRNITERKNAEELLKKSQEQLAGITANLPGIVFQFYAREDGTSGLKYADGKIGETLGLQNDETLYERFISSIHPEDTAMFNTALVTAVQNFTPYFFEGRFIKPNEEIIWVRIQSIPFIEEPEKVFNGIVLDITAEKLAEALLRESEQRFRILAEKTGTIIYSWDLVKNEIHREGAIEETLGYTIEEFKEMGNEKYYDLLLPDELVEIKKLFEEAKTKGGNFSYNYQLRHKNGHYIIIEDNGVVLLDNNGSAVLVIGSLKDVTQRINQENIIKKYAEKYLAIESNQLFGFWVVDNKGTIVEVNKKYLQYTGYTKEEVLNFHVPKFDALDNDKIVRNRIQRVIKKGHESFETKHRKKDGSVFDVEIDLIYLKHEDNFVCFIYDISERKNAEDATRKSEIKYRTLLDNLPQKVFYKDVDSKYIAVNPAYSSDFNLKPEDFVGKTDFELYPKELAQKYRNDDLRIMSNRKIENIEENYIHDGKEYIVNTVKLPAINEMGNTIGILGIFWDITENKMAEEKLRESEERFRSLYENATIGIYRTTPDGKILLANPALVKMMGYNSFEELAKRNVAAEGSYVETNRRDIFKEILENDGEIIGFESEWIRKDGTIISVRESARAVKNDKGETLCYDGAVEDITETKTALTQIYKLSTAIEQSPLSIMITNIKGEIEFANASCTRITGYELEEIIGCTPKIFKSGKTEKKKYKELWDTILGGEIWNGELLNKRKNGEFYWEYIIISPIYNDRKEIINFVAIKEDITEKKRLEKELNDYRTRLENIVEERTIELKLSEEKYRILAENSEDMIMRFNSNFEHLFVNPAVEKLTGIPAEKFIGKRYKELNYPDEFANFWETVLENVFMTGKIERTEFQLPNGKWIDWILIPEFSEDGKVNSIVTSARDITQIKNYEEDINKALQREIELNELKSRFISTASHEFRTPLATILSSAQLIKKFSKKWTEQELLDQFSSIDVSVKQITEMMDDILLISKTEEGKFKTQLGNIKVDEFISKIIKEHEVLVKENQKISFADKTDSLEINSDKKVLRYIVGNLISNAIKYSGSDAKIKVETEMKKNKLLIHVTDNGIGIADEEQPFIFDPFYRANNAAEIDGTGLGLNIVKRMVEILDGRISLRSKLGFGSSFKVEIPIKE